MVRRIATRVIVSLTVIAVLAGATWLLDQSGLL